MKYFLSIATLVSLGLIAYGLIVDTEYSEKCIGFGSVLLFVVVFPVFSYWRWKDKNLKDYMINKENIDKMRNRNKEL